MPIGTQPLLITNYSLLIIYARALARGNLSLQLVMGSSAALWGLWVVPLRSGDHGYFRYALGIMGSSATLWVVWRV